MKLSLPRRTIRFRIRFLTRPQERIVGQFDPCVMLVVEGIGRDNGVTQGLCSPAGNFRESDLSGRIPNSAGTIWAATICSAPSE